MATVTTLSPATQGLGTLEAEWWAQAAVGVLVEVPVLVLALTLALEPAPAARATKHGVRAPETRRTRLPAFAPRCRPCDTLVSCCCWRYHRVAAVSAAASTADATL